MVGREELLDRAGPKQKIKDDLAKHVAYLGVLADYGVLLLKRSFIASSRNIWDVVLLPILFRQVLACLDSIHIQLEQGAVHGAVPALRSLYEATLSLEWILKNGKEHWGRQYYVAELRQERVWNARLVPGTPENAELLCQASEHFKERIQDAARIEAAQARTEALNKHIATYPEFQAISDRFDAAKGKRRHEPRWYQPGGGPQSIREMAERLERLPEYLIVYGGLSEITHVSRTRGHVQIPSRGELWIEPIRGLQGLDRVIEEAAPISERAFFLIVNEYRPGDPFALKLAGEWKDMRDVPTIDVRPQMTDVV